MTQRPRAGSVLPARAAAAVASLAAAAAAYVQHRKRRAEAENPPLGRFLRVDGVRLHHLRLGQGRPVLFLHGNGTMIEDWVLSGVLDRAAGRYHAVAFDRPGYGYSERPRDRLWTPEAQADLLAEAVRRLGVDPPIVVGHSWGSLVAAAWGLRHPGRVAALVLTSGYYFPSARADVPLLSGPALPVVGDLVRHTLSPLLGRLMWPGMVRHLFRPAPVAGSFRRFPTWMALRPLQLRAAASESALMVPAALRLAGRYPELAGRLPIVIAAGDGDRHVGTEAQSGRLHASLPGSELRVEPGVGHMLHHTAPAATLAAIDRAAALAVGEGQAGTAVLDFPAAKGHMSDAASAALGASAA